MKRQPPTLSFAPDLPPPAAGLPLAPMVSIVFLLVSVLLFATQATRLRKDAAVDLPVMRSPLAARETPADITVNLRADGRITVNGQAVAMEKLSGMLAARLPKGAAMPRVVVRADRRQPYGTLDQVLDACQKAGLATVVLRSQGEG